eukprot:CAMPEP_0195317604 /NCGR_PEP_ID=MMETSP0708-20121125/4351_1 /TAXON_ID=33640 /ORGANISM="Asterionellopsis glacialis, Strain CCMP134" /LENGTH=70 /DNA_ID=CAMNT_0040383343 /DNA_START=520 /DNA_END=732 /DNA_ORIENTATION=+
MELNLFIAKVCINNTAANAKMNKLRMQCPHGSSVSKNISSGISPEKKVFKISAKPLANQKLPNPMNAVAP